MRRLWTPWRLEFVTGPRAAGCIFCEKVQQNTDRKNFILYRGAEAFVILNLYPYNNGHLMVVPYAHVGDLEKVEDTCLAEMMRLAKRSVATLRKVMNPNGFNLGFNLGKAAGAGIHEHLHLHIVPRWEGDTNFMPVLCETRIIPELLETTYDKLLAAGIADDDEKLTDQ